MSIILNRKKTMRKTIKALSFISAASLTLILPLQSANASDVAKDSTQPQQTSVVSLEGSTGCSDAVNKIIAAQDTQTNIQYDYICSNDAADVYTAPTRKTPQEFVASAKILTPAVSISPRFFDKCTASTEASRSIKSELQVDVTACLLYGRTAGDGQAGWTRRIDFDWTAYIGFPSVENKFSTLSTQKGVDLSFTVVGQRQNGIFPPTELGGSVRKTISSPGKATKVALPT